MKSSNAVEPVWLSTMGYALQDGLMASGPLEPVHVVQHFELGRDQLMLTELLTAPLNPGLSVAPWLALEQQGIDAVLYLDHQGQACHDETKPQVLASFYRQHPQLTNLSADDLYAMGSVDTGSPLRVPEEP